ncbi:MAG: PGPGW domain-containing protein, partial [Dehalococcoidia bacterium]
MEVDVTELQTGEMGGTTNPRRPVLRQLRRLAVVAAGFAVLFVGLILAALPMIPGGFPGIVLGLTILSAELNWAKRLRAKTLRTARRALPNISWSRAFRSLPSRRDSLGGSTA